MNITIIGTGNMARGIGTRLVAGGNNLIIIGRDPEATANLASQLRTSARQAATITTAPFGHELRDEIIVLAVWYSAAAEIIEQYGPQLIGKVVVDITNPLNASYDGLVTEPGSSAAEEIAKLVPATRVVKAFNTTFASTLLNGAVAGQSLDVFIAGDDADAKAAVAQFVEAGAMRPIDAGPLIRSRELEAVALLGITLQGTLGTGFGSAWKILA